MKKRLLSLLACSLCGYMSVHPFLAVSKLGQVRQKPKDKQLSFIVKSGWSGAITDNQLEALGFSRAQLDAVRHGGAPSSASSSHSSAPSESGAASDWTGDGTDDLMPARGTHGNPVALASHLGSEIYHTLNAYSPSAAHAWIEDMNRLHSGAMEKPRMQALEQPSYNKARSLGRLGDNKKRKDAKPRRVKA